MKIISNSYKFIRQVSCGNIYSTYLMFFFKKYTKSCPLRCLVLLFLFFIIFGCNKHKEINYHNESIEKINVNIENVTEDSNLLSNFKYICLEETDKSLIGSIDKILIRDNRIYVLDAKISKSVFIFDTLGNFIFKIKKNGRGPGEYLQLNDFELDEANNLLLLDVRQKEILKYTEKGKYLESIKIDFWSHSFSSLNDNCFIFYRNNMRMKDERNIGYNIFLFDLAKNTFFEGFPFRNQLDDQDIVRMSKYRLLKSNDIVLFSPYYTNDIYELTESSFILRYQFDFGNKNLNPYIIMDKQKSDWPKVLYNSDYVVDIENYYETDLFFMCSAYYNNRVYNIVYSKLSKKNLVFDSYLKNYGTAKCFGVYKDYFIGIVSPSIISSINNHGNQSNPKIPIVKNFSNPILFLYKLKEF